MQNPESKYIQHSAASQAGMALQDLSPRARQIHCILPQTQCRRCGYPDCAGYAQAVDAGEAAINRCPPGGEEGIQRIAQLMMRTPQAGERGQEQTVALMPLPSLDADCGQEGSMTVAVIDEEWCIGCTLCIQACPTDAIVGSNKRMHTVIEDYCTGCDLCALACPVDCIQMDPISGDKTGWQAWSQQQAQQALQRYTAKQDRVQLLEKQRQEAQTAVRGKKQGTVHADEQGKQGVCQEGESVQATAPASAQNALNLPVQAEGQAVDAAKGAAQDAAKAHTDVAVHAQSNMPAAVDPKKAAIEAAFARARALRAAAKTKVP